MTSMTDRVLRDIINLVVVPFSEDTVIQNWARRFVKYTGVSHGMTTAEKMSTATAILFIMLWQGPKFVEYLKRMSVPVDKDKLAELNELVPKDGNNDVVMPAEMRGKLLAHCVLALNWDSK
jgi:hypothetical protein